jgi:predicted regulator of Ras-like GTPase activity (Roadblock/LC7/MglB family)
MNPEDEAAPESDQEIEKTDQEITLPLDVKLLEELRNLRSRAGIRASMVIGYDGSVLGIHEDAAYVPKALRKGPHARSSKIDTNYFGKWSTSIHRTIEFVSEGLFENGVKFILLEGTDQMKAIIVNMKQETKRGKSFLLVGILPTKGTVGLAYQEMKDAAERIAKILQEQYSNSN